MAISERWGHWILDAYGGAWFYTTNPAYYDIPEPAPQSESPIGSLERHLSYSFKNPRKWVSLDCNFWWGGMTALNSIRNLETKRTRSRVAATLSLPFTKHQSVKRSYSHVSCIRFGGDYHNVHVGWQYSWLGKRW